MQYPESSKHGLAAGEAGRPERPDWTIDQGWENYTAADHGVWKVLFERQTKLLPGRACDEFVQGMQALPIGAEQIPDFRRLSDVLTKHTGWQVVAVPGLVPDEVFFEHLANRRFPAGQFIRKPHELDYLEEPDVFHDVFGHVPMLMNRSEEHTSELQSLRHLVCRLLLEKKKTCSIAAAIAVRGLPDGSLRTWTWTVPIVTGRIPVIASVSSRRPFPATPGTPPTSPSRIATTPRR